MNNLGRSTSVSLNNSHGIITLKDELVHKYFTYISWEKDNNTPVGYAEARTLYHKDILKYWTSYDGVVVIHAQLTKREENNTSINALPNTSLKSKTIQQINVEVDDENKIRINNEYYNYSFIGKIHKVRHIGQNIIIKFEDLGWKFLQKVPKDFRDTYIAGQSLDNAFQAICEFLGVDFAYSIEDLNQYNFAADGYSIEKDGTIIEEVPSILSEYDMKNEEITNADSDEELANGLQEIGDEYSALESAEIQQIMKNNDSETQQNNETEETEEDKSDLDNKIEQYEQEFNNKIKDLFIGNTIYNSNVTDAILNYDAITITPTVTSDANTSNDTSNTNSSSDTSNTSDNSNNTTSSPISNVPQPTSRAIAAHNKKKIYLNQKYINSLPPQQAAEKAKQTNTYTNDTLKRLRRRAMGLWW